MQHAPSHYYVPHGTRWPILGSTGLFTMMVGAALWLNAYAVGPWLLTAGFALALARAAILLAFLVARRHRGVRPA